MPYFLGEDVPPKGECLISWGKTFPRKGNALFFGGRRSPEWGMPYFSGEDIPPKGECLIFWGKTFPRKGKALFLRGRPGDVLSLFPPSLRNSQKLDRRVPIS